MKRQARNNFLGAFAAGLVVVAFCLILFWHDPLLFWNDDFELSILPVFADMARSWSEGALPLLSPYSWVCGNLAGEFQYGTFSVFVNAAVVLIRKFPLTFPQQAAALSIAHLFVLGMGGYLLARGRKLAPSLSILVALVAALNGWIICWGATDWFGALGAFAWLPWAWWGMERALDPARSQFRFLWPAPFVYLVVTGGFPYTVLMLGLVVAWLTLRSLGRTRKLALILPLLFGVLLGFGLAAPAWLALLDYVHGSARAAQDSAEHFQWRVPVAALPAFILPNWTVTWADFSSRLMPHTATELACGLVPPVALLAGLIAFGRAFVRAIKWELGLFLLVLLLCMLPTANVFRWSFRWLPLLHLVLALCAAESLRLFAASASPPMKRPGVIGFILTLLVIGAAWFAGANGARAVPFIWITLGLAGIWALLETFSARARALAPPIIAAASFLATYLCIPPNCGVPKYNLARELTQPAPLDPQRLYLSIYPAPEGAYRLEKQAEPFGTAVRPGSTSMWGGIRLINGYSPIRPSGVAREFAFAIHGEIRPDVANALLERESGADGVLARIGVDGIIVANEVATNPLPDTEWELAVTTKEGRVFHRREPFPVVRSVTALDSRPNEQFATADISRIENRRNRLEADVKVPAGVNPAVLTFSRPFFSGYRARIGDQELRVDSYRGLIPTIEIPAGTNGRLTMVYRPAWLVRGGSVSILCLSIVAVSGVLAISGKRRS
ncbi:MAG: hypothetical protein QOE26_859 [Verrucomicrobiota bacterium]